MKTRKESFDKNIDETGDLQFKLWVSDTCEWVETSIENMYYYLPMNWKFHSCDKIYNYYKKYFKTNLD